MMARGIRNQASWWIPWAFVGGFFVVFGVNGIMVYFAFDSWTGLATENAYQRGLDYNDQLDVAQAQAERGWQGRLAFTPTGPLAGRVAFDLADRYGTPIRGAAVTLSLMRPTHDGADREARLEELGDGRYGAELELPLAGQWDLRLSAEHSRGSYRLDRRILVE